MSGCGHRSKAEKFTNNKMNLVAGPLDPNVKGHKLGGVAAAAKRDHRIMHIAPKTKEFGDAYANGRAIHFGLGLKNGIVLSIFVIYGWSGSNGSKKNASKTNLLMQAILKERETQPSGPVLIMGDLNADPENIATTKEMLVNGLWVDVAQNRDPSFLRETNEPLKLAACFADEGSVSQF